MQGFTALVIFVLNSQLLHTHTHTHTPPPPPPPLSVLTSLTVLDHVSACQHCFHGALRHYVDLYWVQFSVYVGGFTYKFNPFVFPFWGTCKFIEWCTLTAQTHSVIMATNCLSRCPLKMYSIYFSFAYIYSTYIQYACVYVCMSNGCIPQYHYQF